MEMIDRIAQSMARIPSGLFIVTVGPDMEGTGYLASFVQQLGMKPLTFGCAVAPDRAAYPLIKEHRKIGVHFLSEGEGKFLKHFGRGFAPGEFAFEGLDCEVVDGVPMIKEIPFRLVANVTGDVDVGSDHRCLIAQPTAGFIPEENSEQAKPWVHQRKDARKY